MNRFLLRLALIAAALPALQGCNSLFDEEMEDCYEGVSVTLRVDPSTSGAAAAEAAAQNAVLYVFDSEGRFLERRDTEVGRLELLSYRDAGALTVVGWINLSGDAYDVTPFDEEMLRQQGLVALERAGGAYDLPTDLFYGQGELVNASMSLTVEHKDIFATRRTGQVSVTVRQLKEYAGVQDDDFYLVVKPTASAVDFFGNPLDYTASHTPGATFDGADDLVTGNFNVMPTAPGASMTVEIWHREKGLIYSTRVDQHGQGIEVGNDRTTNILIDFTQGISITLMETLWGVSYPWKTFN